MSMEKDGGRHSSRRTEETTTSRRSEKRPSTATVGSVARASATVTTATAGAQPAERTVPSVSRRTVEGLESAGRAVTAATTTSDNMSLCSPLQRTSDQRLRVCAGESTVDQVDGRSNVVVG